MLTRQAMHSVRSLLREQAFQKWRARPVQGKVAQMSAALYTTCLDLRWYMACRIPETWHPLPLPAGQLPVRRLVGHAVSPAACHRRWLDGVHARSGGARGSCHSLSRRVRYPVPSSLSPLSSRCRYPTPCRDGMPTFNPSSHFLAGHAGTVAGWRAVMAGLGRPGQRVVVFGR